jgi:hypothetical protein
VTSKSSEVRIPQLGHSHAERWAPAVGMQLELKGLARDMLPVLKNTKRLMIGLAALAIDESNRARVPGIARELSLLSHQSAQTINAHQDNPVEVVVAGPIVASLHQLEVWAQVAAQHGLGAETASGLRAAYRSLRSSCQVLWPSELIPEGRDVVSGVSHV